MRLHAEAPARKSLEVYLRKVKRPQGRLKTTLGQDLTKLGIKLDLSKEAQTLKNLPELRQDRKNWRGIVRQY